MDFVVGLQTGHSVPDLDIKTIPYRNRHTPLASFTIRSLLLSYILCYKFARYLVMMSTNPLELPKPEEEIEQPSTKRDFLGCALANVVDRARRLKMSSVENVTYLFDKSSDVVLDYGTKPSSVKTQVSKPKLVSTRSRLWRRLQKSEIKLQTPRSTQSQTARLPLPPPPPPPSPRCPKANDICVALEHAKELLDNYQKTDELIDGLLEQATELNREVLSQWQLQREADLVRDIEVEYSEDYMYIMLESIRAEFKDPDPCDK
ncbi:uncharacterized protein LOC110190808 [Drosophila serrata]|uniref:uncharacterized protein LOC110190808 n=1 Tax=Drosophila serrata TaxID=7274 RepID=UPI000A1D1388|nr:uncharacterized protein LOC110190808 [Drosophila serrata]